MFAIMAMFACGASEGVQELPAFPEPELPAAVEPPPVELTLVAVGDVMNHLAVQRSARRTREGFDALFSEVRDTISSADVAFANLETPVAPGGTTASRVFNAPPALVEALHRAGFDVLSTANNHAYDQGATGLVETVQAVESNAMTPIGAGGNCGTAHAPRVLVRKGVRLAWFAATAILNVELNRAADAPCVSMLDASRLAAEIERARPHVDLVVVSLHWGEEYVVEPSTRQVETAHVLAEAGADLVVGHHSHVVGPVERISTEDGRTAWVAYSLGNFISNQSAWYRHGVHAPEHGDPRDGLLLDVRITHRPGDTRVLSVNPVALWAENTTMVGRNNGERPAILVLPVEDHLAALEDRLLAEQRAGRLRESSNTVAKQLRQQITLLRDRLRIVGERTSVRPAGAPETRGASSPAALPVGAAP